VERAASGTVVERRSSNFAWRATTLAGKRRDNQGNSSGAGGREEEHGGRSPREGARRPQGVAGERNSNLGRTVVTLRLPAQTCYPNCPSADRFELKSDSLGRPDGSTRWRCPCISSSRAKTRARQINRRFAARESPRDPPAGARKCRGLNFFCRARFCAILRGKLAALAAARPIKRHARAKPTAMESSPPPHVSLAPPPPSSLSLVRTTSPPPRCRPAAARAPATAAFARA
jgi:hypothetical protein